MRCPDCNAHIGDGEFDPVTYGSPLNHNYIYERDHGRRRCPTMMARELQIQTDVFGGETAYRWGFVRHPHPVTGIGRFVRHWAGETLPPITDRRWFTQPERSFA